MISVSLFAEDFGHEEFLKAMLQRIAEQYDVQAEIKSFSVRGGHGKALTELGQYLRDVHRGMLDNSDMLVVGIDANCNGYKTVHDEIVAATDKYGYTARTACAVPDPHIERWMLLDSAAFKKVLGRGCQAPAYKCGRDHYKQLLRDAMWDAGISPLLGGMEYAEDIVNAMDFQRVRQSEDSFDKLLDDLEDQFRSHQ